MVGFMKKVSITEAKNRLSRLIRDGVVRPSRAALSRELFRDQPPRPKDRASAVKALIDERRKSR
jgi:hypothetical protein